MAQVNLGSIKFKWKGTYAGGTAYTIDDVVSYNGSSYICIQASTGNLPTNATYFEQMSSAGTNGTDGTDLGTTLTTQGDLVYRDGSGLQRLPKGTAGKALLMNSGATAPEWGDVSSKVLGITQFTDSTRRVLSNTDIGVYGSFDTNYTQIKANSKLRFDISIMGFQPDAGAVNHELIFNGTTFQGFGSTAYHAQAYPGNINYSRIIDGDSSTGTKAWKYQWNHRTSTGRPFQVMNPTDADDNRLENSTSTIIITELDI